jgi:hypothetical protein
MQRAHKSIFWAIILSETSHIFCCVLPTLFSVIGLFAGLGFVVTLPPGLEALHEALHAYELPMMAFSAAVMVLGWILYGISRRMDCHDTGCVHGACAPKKNTAHTVLKIATVLFVFNVMIYFGFHVSHG